MYCGAMSREVHQPRRRAPRVLSAADIAVGELRRLIQEGRLAPGERIRPEQLAEELSVSRTPIRDALMRLKGEGLITIVPRVGAFVRPITGREIDEVYQIKAAVYPLAAAWATANADEASILALQGRLSQLHEHAAAARVAECAADVEALHVMLFEMSQSDPLIDVYHSISGRVRTLRELNMSQPGRLKTSVMQQDELVGAVIARDSEEASRIMRLHMIEAAVSTRAALRTRVSGENQEPLG